MLHQTKLFHNLYRSVLLLIIFVGGGLFLPGAITPTFADTPPVNGSITAGTLSETATGTYTFSGHPGDTPTFPMAFTVSDLRGSAAGWKVSISSTQFTDTTSDVLPPTATTITSSNGTCATSGTCTGNTETNVITGVVAIPTDGTAVNFYKAAATTGAGIYTITPTFSVVIPGGTLVGTYTSTITLTSSSLP